MYECLERLLYITTIYFPSIPILYTYIFVSKYHSRFFYNIIILYQCFSLDFGFIAEFNVYTDAKRALDLILPDFQILILSLFRINRLTHSIRIILLIIQTLEKYQPIIPFKNHVQNTYFSSLVGSSIYQYNLSRFYDINNNIVNKYIINSSIYA